MIDSLTKDVQLLFEKNNIKRAIVGFSGGIDSSLTAAILSRSGIPTTLVLCEAENQKRSSDIDVLDFSKQYGLDYRIIKFHNDIDSNAGKEAALPILRNAYFYGVAAEYNSEGIPAVVVGTANFDEASYLGFWGKASDAAQDFYLISHLTKNDVYLLSKELDIPESILKATPSGDLLYSGELNDFKMIGASYDDIELIGKYAEFNDLNNLYKSISFVNDPVKFCNNVLKNAFKYQHPFPGTHLNNRLEFFRINSYESIRSMCSHYLNNII